MAKGVHYIYTPYQWELGFVPDPRPCYIGRTVHMNRQQLLDTYFLDARAKLIDLAAFLDRIGRADGESDFRLKAFGKALEQLKRNDDRRAEHVLLSLSDPTPEPIAAATTKAACGAWKA